MIRSIANIMPLPTLDSTDIDELQDDHEAKAEASCLRAAIDEATELRDELHQKNLK